MSEILVTGGLGFIGSHTCVSLLKSGYSPVVVDNLSNSLASVQAGIEELGKQPIKVYHGDIRDTDLLDNIFTNHNIEGVIHFAASKAVGESVQKHKRTHKCSYIYEKSSSKTFGV
jgi:UDP-glucose 4-epimerase